MTNETATLHSSGLFTSRAVQKTKLMMLNSGQKLVSSKMYLLDYVIPRK